MVVTFPDIDTRDTVRSSAAALAAHKDSGMRLEIPEHLRPSLRALEKLSFDLKKKNPGMKRNIKFDDAEMDLVLDVKLGQDLPWQKIRPENARAVRRAPQINDAGFHDELDSNALQSMLDGSATPASGANATPQGP